MPIFISELTLRSHSVHICVSVSVYTLDLGRKKATLAPPQMEPEVQKTKKKT